MDKLVLREVGLGFRQVEVDNGLAHTGLEGWLEWESSLQGLVEFIGTFWWVELERGAWINRLSRSGDASNGVSVLRHREVVGTKHRVREMGNDCGEEGTSN